MVQEKSPKQLTYFGMIQNYDKCFLKTKNLDTLKNSYLFNND